MTIATADKSGQTLMEESDNYRNQTFNVYDQEVTLVGRECENRTEKLHSGITITLQNLMLNNKFSYNINSFNFFVYTYSHSRSGHHDWYSSSYWKHCFCIARFQLCTAYTFDGKYEKIN
jgi:hypothetical protein